MKKIYSLLLFLILSVASYSQYDFPIKNPYASSIVGGTQYVPVGLPEEIPLKDKILKTHMHKYTPENMWYHKGLKYSVAKQKGIAPLMFVLAGTGASHASDKNRMLAKIFYDRGYHVICLPSTFNVNFLINASRFGVPGVLIQDATDLYNVMYSILVKEKLDYSEIDVVGYSLGGTHAAAVKYVDSQVKKMGINRVFMINPAVDVSRSSKVVDDLLSKNIKSKRDIAPLINKILDTFKKKLNSQDTKLTEDELYKMFADNELTDEQMEEIIGLAFRMTSVDVNFLVDQLTRQQVYSSIPPKKFSDMYPYLESVNFASFDDYLNKLAYPFYKKRRKPGYTFEQMLQEGDLKIIGDYLRKDPNIVAVTNEDDFILNSEDKEFLKKTFGKRFLLYPVGGHCGNMFYQTNVDKMLDYFDKGEFNNEI